MSQATNQNSPDGRPTDHQEGQGLGFKARGQAAAKSGPFKRPPRKSYPGIAQDASLAKGPSPLNDPVTRRLNQLLEPKTPKSPAKDDLTPSPSKGSFGLNKVEPAKTALALDKAKPLKKSSDLDKATPKIVPKGQDSDLAEPQGLVKSAEPNQDLTKSAEPNQDS
ncbi:MAG: hypothetical protein LBI10_07815, partial [Deltaproteobacteria bacterium]|nr:hypothetical protein [Deltaproteobacteria bacterium]